MAGGSGRAHGIAGRAREVSGRARLAAPLFLVVLWLEGCSVFSLPPAPSWVPLLGRTNPSALPNTPPAPPAKQATAPLISAGTAAAVDPDTVLDRVICVVNNDAITLFELDEAEAYYLFESKEPPLSGEARTQLRDRLLQRIIDNRLQLQQADRERITVDDIEMNEQIADLMKKMNVKTEVELEQTFRRQGVTMDSIKKRVRDQLAVERVRRRRVTMRVTVTEQEIDRYLEQNREKLETGLTFEARHILFIPDPNRGEDGWEDARRRASDVYEKIVAGAEFADLAKEYSQDGSGKDGGALGVLKRGELAADIEKAILDLSPGETSAPFRSQVGYHLFKLDSKERLGGEGLGQARNQIRDILLREKYAARLKEWMTEIRQRAIIDMRL
jgi:peptidyl-prolyl cis-trans isomerase SurA